MGAREAAGLGVGDRSHRSRLVEPDPLVELVRQSGVEIVALQFRLGAVDDADGTLQPRRGELLTDLGARGIAEREEEGRDRRVVAQAFVALGVRDGPA